MNRPAFKDGGIVVMAGLFLYGAAAGVEAGLGAGPAVSAVLEEFGKMVLLLGFGWRGWGSTREGRLPRQIRARILGLARGLSLGLVAVAVFAGAENLAYLVAFQEAGVLARLFWSLPVHLVAGLLEALGVIRVFRGLERAQGLVGVSLALASLGLACAWHLGANLLLLEHLSSATFLGGVVVANLLFLVLLWQFLKQAYLGGFLYGAD